MTPFLFLDEVDAALDAKNIKRLASFLVEMKSQMQVIVASHREMFYCHADAVVGICPDVSTILQ